MSFNEPRRDKEPRVTRAKEIRLMKAEGLTKKQIADELGISEATVKSYCRVYFI